jgi:hypothetical protein
VSFGIRVQTENLRVGSSILPLPPNSVTIPSFFSEHITRPAVYCNRFVPVSAPAAIEVFSCLGFVLFMHMRNGKDIDAAIIAAEPLRVRGDSAFRTTPSVAMHRT